MTTTPPHAHSMCIDVFGDDGDDTDLFARYDPFGHPDLSMLWWRIKKEGEEEEEEVESECSYKSQQLYVSEYARPRLAPSVALHYAAMPTSRIDFVWSVGQSDVRTSV